MIEITGNIFDQDCDAICITTNGMCKLDSQENLVAVMGAGLAKHAQTRYPKLPLMLAGHLMESGNHVGLIYHSAIQVPPVSPYDIVAFPTKHHWKHDSHITLVLRSLAELNRLTDTYGWKKVILPRVGCGLGGLNWDNVKPYLEGLDDRFFVITLD